MTINYPTNMNLYKIADSAEALKDLCIWSVEDNSTDSPIEYSNAIVELLRNPDITLAQHRQFMKLADQIQHRNVFITTYTDLQVFLKVEGKNLIRSISRLSPFLKVKAPKGHKNSLRVVELNPKLVWKGDKHIQELAIEQWENSYEA